MKLKFKRIAFVFLIFVIKALLISCVQTSESQRAKEAVKLEEKDIEKFLIALPEILRFANVYQSSLSEYEQENPDYNEKYYRALTNSAKIRLVLEESGLGSMERLIEVYDNVVYAYTIIKDDLRDFDKQMAEIKLELKKERVEIEKKTNNYMINEEEMENYINMLKILDEKEEVYNNILTVKKYESKIDVIIQSIQPNM